MHAQATARSAKISERATSLSRPAQQASQAPLASGQAHSDLRDVASFDNVSVDKLKCAHCAVSTVVIIISIVHCLTSSKHVDSNFVIGRTHAW